MTGRHDAGPRVTDVALNDRAIACHAEMVKFFADEATHPIYPDVSTAWRHSSEALVRAMQIMQRAQAVLAEVVHDG